MQSNHSFMSFLDEAAVIKWLTPEHKETRTQAHTWTKPLMCILADQKGV